MKGAEGPGGEGREAAAGGGWHRTGGDRVARGPGPGGSRGAFPAGAGMGGREPGTPAPQRRAHVSCAAARDPSPREEPWNAALFKAPLKRRAPREGRRFRTWLGRPGRPRR